MLFVNIPSSKGGRIEAHFLTCFIALMIYRILEKKLGDKYTCEDIIRTLREMDMRKVVEHQLYKNTDDRLTT